MRLLAASGTFVSLVSLIVLFRVARLYLMDTTARAAVSAHVLPALAVAVELNCLYSVPSKTAPTGS